MNIKSFLKLVEIQTKVASVLPFIIGILFTFYRYGIVKPVNAFIFLVSLLAIDLATTTTNNYMDYKRAIVKEGYNYERHNAIVAHGLTEKQVKATIFMLLTIGMLVGFILVLKTDLLVLFIGILSFGVGVFYSFGPIPISRTPLGELISGLFMGGLIFFLTIYVQAYDLGLIIFRYVESRLTVSIALIDLIAIFIVAIPLIAGIANIMLANNICDVEEDTKNKRYTMPHYIGKNNSIRLFAILYYLSYIAIVAGVILGILPLTCLLIVITFPLLQKGISKFKQEQNKATTFVLSVQNFVLFSLAYGLTLGFGIFVQWLL
jgi:1,4-dihydroxy-2-naphthoate octaprenyltransferase